MMSLTFLPVLATSIWSDLPGSPAEWIWCIFGLSGNIVFGSRFFLQWIHSERRKESHVPLSFWWLSVIGTLVLFIYFFHMRQWVALLGNGPQLVPYTRNLILIYRKKRNDEVHGVGAATAQAAAVEAVAGQVGVSES
jgi:lipid-A-disaccharide synthase-like uncharacterized protein